MSEFAKKHMEVLRVGVLSCSEILNQFGQSMCERELLKYAWRLIQNGSTMRPGPLTYRPAEHNFWSAWGFDDV